MKKTVILIGLLAFALGIGIARYYLPQSSPELETIAEGYTKVKVVEGKFGGDFTLFQGDKPVKLSDFQGKLVVMYFGFASCPDVCPTTLTIIASALKQLTQEELEDVQPVFISIDPERDQGEKLDAYATYFHPGFIGITGTPEEVQKVANQYGGFFIKVESDSAMGYLVEHTSKTYVISKDGRYVSILPHDMTTGLALNAIRSGL
ncbi:MAG: SCO family protein [Xanthomonadales bacterium]|nr:SCO family protein [Xanthomonadales bacterium]